MLSVLRRLAGAPTLRVAFLFGLSGAGFVGANLLLARSLSVSEYALFALAMALLQVSLYVAPLGADGVVIRRGLDPEPEMLRRTVATSLAVALGTAVVGGLIYPLGPELLLLLLLGVGLGGLTVVAAAFYQSRMRFELSLPVYQSGNIILLLAAVVVTLAGMRLASAPLGLLVVGYAGVALGTWRALLRGGAPTERPPPYSWTEGLSFAGVSAIGNLLGQLERLLIPWVFDLRALATYGVLAATVIAPLRMLQMGVGYTLLPRLRAASSVAGRRRLLLAEGGAVAAVVALAVVAVWYLAPWVVRVLLADKYELSTELVLAGLAAGLTRVLTSYSSAVPSAVGSTRDLVVLNVLGVVSIGATVAGALIGSRWGLAGLIYGIAAGWLIRALLSAVVSWKHVR